MDEQWCLGMAEVKQGQVEEIDDQQKLAWPEVTADPEHDEAEEEEVVLWLVSHDPGGRLAEQNEGADVRR